MDNRMQDVLRAICLHIVFTTSAPGTVVRKTDKNGKPFISVRGMSRRLQFGDIPSKRWVCPKSIVVYKTTNGYTLLINSTSGVPVNGKWSQAIRLHVRTAKKGGQAQFGATAWIGSPLGPPHTVDLFNGPGTKYWFQD
jgi:hypothetical protein